MKDRVTVAWYRLVASDPGLTRLELAARVLVTVVVALGVLGGLMRWAGLPLPGVLVGAVVALMGSAMVNDTHRQGRRYTTVLLPLPAAAAMALAAALSPWPMVADAMFVGVSFAAVYVRRFGARGFALGMIAFITYFLALFLHLRFAQWPATVLGAALGAGCAFAVRFGLFPSGDTDIRRARAVLRAFYARLGQVLDEMAARVNAAADEDDWRPLRRLILQLNETALMVESALDTVDAPGARDASGMQPSLALFDLELAVERLAAASRDHPLEADRQPVVDALRTLRRAAVARHRGPAGIAFEAPRLGGYRWEAALRDVARALDAAPSEDTLGPAAADSNAPVRAGAVSSDAAEGASRLRPSTRQAIQVATAAGLAIAAGELVSPQRWYWAAITAFVVFAGTSSRGETLSKGWQRILGTCAGVAAGIAVALAVGDHHGIAIGLMLACVFLAFYLIRVSYALMIFWITIALALLYGLVGRFSVELLELRLLETVIGTAIGVGVASVVLPTSTRATIREGSRRYLDTLAQLIECSVARLTGRDTSADPAGEARRLDREFQSLSTAAKPLTRGLAGAFGRRGARNWLRGMLACRHYARQLAQCGQRARPDGADSTLGRAFDAAAAEVIAEIRALRAGEAPDGDLDPTRTTLDALNEAGESMRAASPELQAAARNLRRIHRLVVALRHDFLSAAGPD